MNKETKDFVSGVISKYVDQPIDMDDLHGAYYQLGNSAITATDAVAALGEICKTLGIGDQED